MYNIDANEIMVVGDWHRDTDFAMMVLKRANNLSIKVIVHTGDFGLWEMGDDFLSTLENYLNDNDMMIIFVDGNHENHNLIRALEQDNDSGLNIVSEHIFHAPRGYRWTFNGATWMALGGAVSVDRIWRTLGFDWFMDERITEADADYAMRDGEVDVMVCHDAPFNVPTLRIAYSGQSNWPVEDLAFSNHNQKIVEKVMLAKNPQYLFHGHHHRDYVDYLEDTKIIGLNCNHPNMGIARNFTLVDNFGHKII